MQLVMFFRRKLFHALVAFDRQRPLLGRQRDPFMHALLNALLAVRRQAWIAAREANPVLAPLRVEFVPLLLERGQDRFLLGGQFRPGSTRRLRKSPAGGRGRADKQGKRQYYCRDCA